RHQVTADGRVPFGLVLTDDAEREYASMGIRVRRAAKPHTCDMPERFLDGVTLMRWNGHELPSTHTPEIERGHWYVEDCGEVPAYASGARYCAHCAIAAGLARWIVDPRELVARATR